MDSQSQAREQLRVARLDSRYAFCQMVKADADGRGCDFGFWSDRFCAAEQKRKAAEREFSDALMATLS